MNYGFIFLRRIADLILMNIFFIRKNKFKFIDKIKEQKKNGYVLIELNLSHILVSTFYVIVSQILSKKFKIIFFYYSKYDYLFKNKLFYFLAFNYFIFLKKNSNAKIINLFVKPTKKEIEDGKKCFKSLKNLNHLINLKYKNIDVGKYIFQSYSRELLEAKVNIKDLD